MRNDVYELFVSWTATILHRAKPWTVSSPYNNSRPSIPTLEDNLGRRSVLLDPSW